MKEETIEEKITALYHRREDPKVGLSTMMMEYEAYTSLYNSETALALVEYYYVKTEEDT